MVKGATITNSDTSISITDFQGLIPGFIARQEAEAGNVIDAESVTVIYTVPIRNGESTIYKVLWEEKPC